VLISDPTLHLSAEERVRSFDPRIDVSGESGRTMRLNMTLPLVYHLLRRNAAEISTFADDARVMA